MTGRQDQGAGGARTLTAESVGLPARLDLTITAPMEASCDLLDEQGRVVGVAVVDGSRITARITDAAYAEAARAPAQRFTVGYSVKLRAEPVAEDPTVRGRKAGA